MHYAVHATDYDGTIPDDDVVGGPTIAALERLRASCRHLILLTGRELNDLLRVLPRIDLFDRVVAENGAVLYTPHSKEARNLAEAPPPRFAERLRTLGVTNALHWSRDRCNAAAERRNGAGTQSANRVSICR